MRSIEERKETAAAEASERMSLGPFEPEVTEVEVPAAPEPIELSSKPAAHAADAPLCYACGSKMQPAGSCYVCPSCGSTSGCS